MQHRILIVDDERRIADTSALILQGEGYQTAVAYDAGSGIARCCEFRPQLVLTDVVMPGMSGKELFGRLMTKKRALKVLYMSGYTEEVLIRHGISGPGVPFLQKPFTAHALALKVREALED